MQFAPLNEENHSGMQPLAIGATNIAFNDEHDNNDNDYGVDTEPLLSLNTRTKRKASRSEHFVDDHFLHDGSVNDSVSSSSRHKAILLSFSLCTTLMSFWVLDSIKDPILEVLSRDLKSCQPLAKMASVLLTLILICGSEFVSYERRRRRRQRALISGDEEEWSSAISTTLFYIVGVPYCMTFILISLCLHFHPDLQRARDVSEDAMDSLPSGTIYVDDSVWKVLGYAQYMAIESYGSISVAAFWSFTNSRFDIISAEKHYGFIIAVAQVGAIIGATIAAAIGKIPGGMSLMYDICGALVVVNMLIITLYNKFYPGKGSSEKDLRTLSETGRTRQIATSATIKRPTTSSESGSPSSALFSGVYLILKHNYVLLILGVSCLFEVAMTCFDYDMKLVGLAKFQSSLISSGTSDGSTAERAFASFIGQFGQLTNILSLLLSYFGFPLLIKRVGLRHTLRVFPSVLLCATIFIFAMTPNLWLIFFTLALLKAMTYSINEPATEILYIPTSNTVKLKAKFWIDVFGHRCAKALGSSITKYAGSADRIATYAAVPSIFTSVILLALSVRVGREFDELVVSGEIIGLEDEMMEDDTFRNQYQCVCTGEEDDLDCEDDLAEEDLNKSNRGLELASFRYERERADC